jgi:hypothetical protein
MSVIRNLRQKIRDMTERNNRKRISAEEKQTLDGLHRALDDEVRKLEEKERKEKVEPKEKDSNFAFVSSIGATGQPAKIDADLKPFASTWNLMEHLDADGEMYPAGVCRWQDRYAILPLGNLVLSVPANIKVSQIGADKRNFTKANLVALGECEPETFTKPEDMQRRYAERCANFKKRFNHG